LVGHEGPTCVATSAQKEEIRKLEKLAVGDIRQICAMPIEHTLAMQMYFGDLTQKLIQSCFTHSSYLGINPFDGEWDRLGRTLGDGKELVFEADISKQDSDFAPFLMEAVGDFLASCVVMTADERAAVDVLLRDLVHTMILGPGGVLAVKEGGNPSGHALTIVFNIMSNFLCHAYTAARMRITRAQFKTNVRLALVGDDGVAKTNALYTPADLVMYSKELGFTVKVGPLAQLSDVAFLSMRFVRVDDVWVPKPTDPRKMISSLMLRDQSSFDITQRISRYCSVLAQVPFDEEAFTSVDEYVWFLRGVYDVVLQDDPKYQAAIGQHMSREMYASRYMPAKE